MTSRKADPDEGLPSPWGQAYPRCVRLDPGGILVPAATLKILMAPKGRLNLQYVGHAHEGWIGHGDTFVVDRNRPPRVGDLILCDAGGWGDVRRLLRLAENGSVETSLDSLPARRETLGLDRVLGVVRTFGSGGATGRLITAGFPIYSRLAALRYWFRKIQEAPDFGEHATRSIEEKYEHQVEGYLQILDEPLGEELLGLLGRHFPPGAALLIAGSGTGREALHLAREGYRVTGFDLVPVMVEASHRNATAMGIDAEFFVGDLCTLDLKGRVFDGAYITPLVYSFVPGRSRRVECLRRLGRHLKPGGKVVYSPHLMRHRSDVLRAALLWCFRRVRGCSSNEFGDWYTWFLTPQGDLGKSFSRRFLVRQVVHEAREAGFGHMIREAMTHFVAGDFKA